MSCLTKLGATRAAESFEFDWDTDIFLWLEQLVESLGDKMPDSDVTHMPIYIKPKDLQFEYCREYMEKENIDPTDIDATQVCSAVGGEFK